MTLHELRFGDLAIEERFIHDAKEWRVFLVIPESYITDLGSVADGLWPTLAVEAATFWRDHLLTQRTVSGPRQVWLRWESLNRLVEARDAFIAGSRSLRLSVKVVDSPL